MNLKNQDKRLKNFKKMKIIVNANRSISLIEIYKISKKIRQNYNNFQISKYFIEQIGEKLQLFSNLKYVRKDEKSVLWIYITEEQKYTKDFYLETEKVIVQKASKSDIFIAVGQNSKQFLAINNFEIIKSFDQKINKNISEQISFISQLLIDSRKVDKINILLHTNKIPDSVLTIYPMNKINFNYQDSPLVEYDVAKKKFYPNVEQFLKTQEKIYLDSIIKIALLESSFIVFKNKIIQENKTLKEIDQTILNLRRNISKIKQELELEELVLLTSNEIDTVFGHDKPVEVDHEK